MLAISIKLILGDDDNDDKSDDNVVMKSLFVTKKQHFLELHQDKVSVSFFTFYLQFLDWCVCLSVCLLCRMMMMMMMPILSAVPIELVVDPLLEAERL